MSEAIPPCIHNTCTGFVNPETHDRLFSCLLYILFRNNGYSALFQFPLPSVGQTRDIYALWGCPTRSISLSELPHVLLCFFYDLIVLKLAIKETSFII